MATSSILPARPRRSLRLFGALAAILPAVVATAQDAPPQPALKNHPAVWLGYLVIFVLLVLVITVSLIPSKRGHQD